MMPRNGDGAHNVSGDDHISRGCYKSAVEQRWIEEANELCGARRDPVATSIAAVKASGPILVRE
jgi:hypothetical protein